MAVYNKFNATGEDLVRGAHNFGTHVYKVMLTNTAPLATNAVKADLVEIAAGNGYPAGGGTSTITITRSGGTTTVTGSDVITNATGAVGPFRYAVLYNDTQTAPAKPLVGWWDYGASISLANGESFTVDVTAAGLFTLA